MPLIVEDLTEEPSLHLDALDKVRRAEQLLADAAPVQARWVDRHLRRIYVGHLRRRAFRPGRDVAALDVAIVRDGTPADLGLLLLYLAVASRLRRFVGRRASGDRRAQYWQRLQREVVTGARLLDRWEDPSGYVPGVSTGRWEPWARRWLGKGGLAQVPMGRALRNQYRDLRHLGLPRWLARILIAYWGSRYRAV